MSERNLGFFVKVKEDQNFNRRYILNILRIKFISDAEIGEKDSFRSDTKYRLKWYEGSDGKNYFLENRRNINSKSILPKTPLPFWQS